MKKINLLYIVTITFFMLTMNSVSAIQTVNIEKNSVLGMNDCIRIALNNSPIVRKAIFNLDISKSRLGAAKSAYFPTLSLGGNIRQNYTERNHHLGSTNSRILPGFDASLSQLLWNFGKSDANIRMQKFNKIASEFDFEETVLNTAYNVKLQYYSVLAAKAFMDVEKFNVQINERNYQRTKAYYDEGIRSKIDLVNAEVNLSDSKISLIKAENIYKAAMVNLNNSMYVAYTPEYNIENTETFHLSDTNVPVSIMDVAQYESLLSLPQDVFEATIIAGVEKSNILEGYSFKKYPYTFEKSLELAYENRHDLKALNATVQAMKQYVLLTKRQYFPDLKGGLGYNYTNSRHYAENGLNLAVNLTTTFNAMEVKHEVDIANSELNLAKNEVELLKQNMYFNIQNAYVDMIEYEKQIPLLQTKVKQSLENLELADGRYSVGLGDYIELQDARVNYNNAQSAFVQAVFNYNVARATLEKEIALPQEETLEIKDVKNYQKELKKQEKQERKNTNKKSKKDSL